MTRIWNIEEKKSFCCVGTRQEEKKTEMLKMIDVILIRPVLI